MTKDYQYQSCFAELIIKPLVSKDKDKCLALASLIEISSFLPAIDTATNLDLLPIAFNACVINRVNKNRDVVDTRTALAFYKNFINKPINVEHDRKKVVGVILTAGFSEFGTDRPLTEDQVKGMDSPFNVTLGGVIWRVICPELSDHIEESSDPTSDKYLNVSASWELGFSDYRIALLDGGSKNLADAKIISDPTEVTKIKDKLTALGGDGKYNDLFAYRMPSYDVIPLGIGLTEKPAAEVKGIATKNTEQANLSVPEVFHNEPVKEKVDSIPIPVPVTHRKTVNLPAKETFGDKNANKISQSDNSDVKIKRNTDMKITSLQDITDDTLKECTASSVAEFISTELKKGSEVWEKQKNALNDQLSKAEADSTKLKAEQSKLQSEFDQVKATVEALQTAKAEQEKVEKFNLRMATISEAYNLDDEVRAALVEDIKSIASDEEFDKWQAKAKVLLKGFAKFPPKKKDDEAPEDKKEAKCKGEDMEAKKKANASEANASEANAAVEDAINNGKEDSAGLPNGSSAEQPTLKQKYQGAFAKENFVISI